MPINWVGAIPRSVAPADGVGTGALPLQVFTNDLGLLYSPGRTHTKETGFFTDSGGHNLCFFVKKPGF